MRADKMKQITEQWWNDWEYENVDWVPCPDCFDIDEYTSELWIVLDSYGNTDCELDLDSTFNSYHGSGVIVECQHDENDIRDYADCEHFGPLNSRLFKGCKRCGGAGETLKHFPEDDIVNSGKSWNQWIVIEGGVTPGTGKIPKANLVENRRLQPGEWRELEIPDEDIAKWTMDALEGKVVKRYAVCIKLDGKEWMTELENEKSS